MKRSIIGGFLLLSFTTLPLAVESQAVLPSEAPPVLIAPAVEDIQPVDGTVIPVEGGATVKLINKTNARIRYQFLGKPGTRQTILEGQAESKLTKLALPISLTFRRIDNGFLKIVLKSSKAGMLEVELDENTDFDSDRISLWVSPKGEIYLN